MTTNKVNYKGYAIEQAFIGNEQKEVFVVSLNEGSYAEFPTLTEAQVAIDLVSDTHEEFEPFPAA